MHNYYELAYRGVSFSLDALDKLQAKIDEAFQSSGATSLVKHAQMIQAQKAVIAIGIFSLFESILQDRLSAKNGFKEAKEIMLKSGNTALLDRFEMYYYAINALKHGEGDSYRKLVAKAGLLPFTIKMPGQNFFDEGDVSEISTLIKVDNQFVSDCAQVIRDVSLAIRATDPGFTG